MNDQGDCVKCASGQPFDHAEAQRDLTPASDYLKGLLRTLLEDLTGAGFTQDMARQFAEKLLVETMQIDQQAQEGTCSREEAVERAQALYNCAREARPTTTLAAAATERLQISLGRRGVGIG